MKKVLGASIGVLAITFMSFASPQQANIKGNDAQVVYEQTVHGLDKSKPKPPTKIVINKTIEKTVSTVITTGLTAKNLAQLNDVMNKY